MWPRAIEVTLGCWLLATPFVFRGTEGIGDFTTTAFASGAIVISASALSVWRPMRRAHFVTLLVALALAVHGYFSAARPGPPAAQNEIVIGLTLLLFAVLPGEPNELPVPWRRTGGTRG
jgi:hypothetical protein